MDCPRKTTGYCEKVDSKVNPRFCEATCKGDHEGWKGKLSQPEDGLTGCAGCEFFKPCQRICMMLTRGTDLRDHFQKSGQCPLLPKVFSQPASHPARWKKIFTRADGSLVDLIDMFHGNSVFLCCSGPSFNSVDKSLLTKPGILTMAVNNTGHLFRPDLWTAQDPPYRFMKSIWEDPKIMKFTLWDYRRKPYWDNGKFSSRTLEQCPNLFFHKRKSNLKADTWLKEDKIVWGTPKELEDGSMGGRSVFLAALHILYFLGFHKVFLLGVDFKMNADHKYWFEEDRGPAAIRNNERVYKQTAEHCINLRPHLEQAGFNVYNCNLDSHLKAFDYYPLDRAIAENVISLKDSTKGMYVKR